MFRWLNKTAEVSQPIPNNPVSFDSLDESFHLLKKATVSVSEEAVKAARVLEDQLRISESRFYSTIDAMSDVVVIKDAEGRWTTVNKYGQKVFEWHHGEYYLKDNKQLREIYPKFAELFAQCDVSDEIAWTTKRPYQIEYSIPCGNAFYHLDVIKTPVFNDGGSRKEMLIIGRDITEKYNHRQRTKACFNALNSASDVIFIVDADRNIFFCNDMFVQKFGFTCHSDVVDKCVCDVVPGMDCSDHMWEVVRSNKIWESTIGQYRLSIVPMMNGVPDPVYYVCTMKATVSNQ